MTQRKCFHTILGSAYTDTTGFLPRNMAPQTIKGPHIIINQQHLGHIDHLIVIALLRKLLYVT
jgi:hypothetical protein